MWATAPYPGGVTSDDENAWDASSYLFELMTRLGDDTDPSAVAALAELRDAPPPSAIDLQAVVLEELAVLAQWLAPGGDNANLIVGFCSVMGKTPKD